MTIASTVSTRRVPLANSRSKRQDLEHPPLGGHSGGGDSNCPFLRGCFHVRPRGIAAPGAFYATAASFDFVKSGFRFWRNAVSASLASGERRRTA